MSLFHLKFLTNVLSDEVNLAQSLPALLPSVAQVSSSSVDEASSAKLHTRLSALLQSKNVHVRWAGVCLVKGMLERHHGCWQTLNSHGETWIKLLLRILEREESEPVIERTVAAVRTIIRMTEGKPELTRTLTTQNLPTFFTHLFSILARPHLSNYLIKTILYHLHESMISHSTTFRSFKGKLQNFVMNYINGPSADPELVDIAARCFASLHLCAAKNETGDQWTTDFLSVLGECHNTCSFIFRTVEEQQPTLPIPGSLGMLQFTTDYISQVPLAVRRLQALSQVAGSFLSMPTKENIKLPIGQLVMIVERILLVTDKSGIRRSTQSDQVTLISVLPQLHQIALNLLNVSIKTLGMHMSPHLSTLQPLILTDCRHSQIDCRVAALRALHTAITSCGVSSASIEHLPKVLQDCLSTIDSLVPKEIASIANKSMNGNGHAQGQKKRKHGNDGADQISHDAAFFTAPAPALVEASISLLNLLLCNTHSVLTKGTRQRIDTMTLRLLTIHEEQLDHTTRRLLLSLLAASLQAPEPSPCAAALLAAGIKTISRYTASGDPETRQLASSLQNEIDNLIHPRFPAMRKRTNHTSDDFDTLDTVPGHESNEEEAEQVLPQETTDQMVTDTEESENGPRQPLFEMPPAPREQEFAPSMATENIPESATMQQDVIAPAAENSPSLAKRPRFSILQSSTGNPEDEESSDDNDENIPDICIDSDSESEDD